MAQCASTIEISLDGAPGWSERCSLPDGHEDAHALVRDGVELLIWVTDGDYSGPRAGRLVRSQLDARFGFAMRP